MKHFETVAEVVCDFHNIQTFIPKACSWCGLFW